MNDKSNSDKKVVGIWIRVSTEDQAKGESPEHHELRARHYAEAKGWEVKEVYHLEALSGKAVMNYPETKRMLNDIRKGHITGLIFSKLARLARNTKELLEFSEIFKYHGADLISLQESIDTSTPAGRLFYTMIAAMAQWEREEIAERISASIPIRAKLGKPLGGPANFGFKWQDKQFVPDEKEAPILKLMFELFLEYKRKRTVARILNEKGYRTRNGSKFSDTTVNRLLRDTVAKGLRRANHTKTVSDNGKYVIKPEEEWVIIPVTPVVSEDIWNKCNAILDGQTKSRQKITKRPVHIFAGYVFCECGGKMKVPSNSPKYICPNCRNKIPTDDLESIYQEQLKGFVLSPHDMQHAFEQADSTIIEKENLIITLQKNALDLKADMDQLVDLYLAKQIPKEGFGERYNPLAERKKQIDEQIPELQGEIDFLKIQMMSKDEILTEAKDLYSRWDKLEREEKRKIIETITEKILVGNEEIRILLHYHPSRLMALEQHQD